MTVATAGATEITGVNTAAAGTYDASLRLLASVNLSAGQRAQIWSIVRYAQNAGLPSTYVQQQIASLLTTQQFVSLHPELQRVYSGLVREQLPAARPSGDEFVAQADSSDSNEPEISPVVSQPRENSTDSKGVRGQIALGSAIAKIQLLNELATTA